MSLDHALSLEAKRWRAYPMGPRLASYLSTGSVDDAGAVAAPVAAGSESVGALAQAGFTAFLRRWHEARPELDLEDVVDLLDELVAMGLPDAALDLAKRRRDLAESRDFRAPFAVGVAAMQAGDLALAKESFLRCRELAPAEPAPYVNLAQICEAQGDDEAALDWVDRGLTGEADNHRLWEVLGRLHVRRHGEETAAALMRDEADRRGAWAGASLAASLAQDGAPDRKALLLKPYYDRGLRSIDFLVDYTAALGIAGEYQAILDVVAEAAAGSATSWQLEVHAAQAHMALGAPVLAEPHLTRALDDADLPALAVAPLRELAEDLRHAVQAVAARAPGGAPPAAH